MLDWLLSTKKSGQGMEILIKRALLNLLGVGNENSEVRGLDKKLWTVERSANFAIKELIKLCTKK